MNLWWPLNFLFANTPSVSNWINMVILSLKSIDTAVADQMGDNEN